MEVWSDRLRGSIVKVELIARREDDSKEIVGTFVSKPRDIILNDYVMYSCKGDVIEKGDFIMIKETVWRAMRCKSFRKR